MIADDRPVPRWRTAALAALTLVLAVAAWTDGGALAGPPPAAATAGPSDHDKLVTSVDRTREIGVSMFSWLTDVIAAGADVSDAEAAAAEAAPEPDTADWGDCPRISYDELAKVLVPTYLEELPRTDGWGHPFEYCLDRERPGSPRYVVGVRSPGRDGRWQGDVYPIGRFAPEEVDRDLVWIDGYFITWPEAE
jgi:hypothetical protein